MIAKIKFLFVLLLLAHPTRVLSNESHSMLLDKLLTLYRELDLPLPAETAQLVRFPNGWISSIPAGKDEPHYGLGFIANPEGEKSETEILSGPYRFSPRNGAPEPIDPATVEPEQFDLQSTGVRFPSDTSLSLAVQCHARGFHPLALALYRFRMEHLTTGSGPTAVGSGGHWVSHRSAATHKGQPGHEAALVLAGEAWNYWLNEIARPGSDWTRIAAAFRKLFEITPEIATEQNRAILESVEKALVPSPAAPESVEADVDALVQCSQEFGLMPRQGRDPVYDKVLIRGFEAVPSLILHLNDTRMTRATVMGFNNFPTMPRRVNELASDLLKDIAGQGLAREWLDRQLGGTVSSEAASRWWEEARKIDEKDYLRSQVFPKEKSSDQPNAGTLAIITARYPELLSTIYLEALDQGSKMQSWTIADAIDGSNLPREVKIDLLRRGAASKSLEHQRAALFKLRILDPETADATLIRILKSVPGKPKGPVWKSEESGLSQLVIGSDSPAVWEAFLVAAKRVDVSLRLEWMGCMSYDCFENVHRTERLHFLSQFLEDDKVRVIANQQNLYDGPSAAFTFPTIRVRDLAAMTMASILKMKEDPKPDWTTEQWSNFRQKVRDNMKNE